MQFSPTSCHFIVLWSKYSPTASVYMWYIFNSLRNRGRKRVQYIIHEILSKIHVVMLPGFIDCWSSEALGDIR
jgi:hypothetical protein